MIVIEAQAIGRTAMIGDEPAGSEYAILCDECGEPITDLGDAISLLARWPGKQIKVAHRGRGRTCYPGITTEYPTWEFLLETIGQLLWDFAVQHEGEHGGAKVTLDHKANSCTIETGHSRISVKPQPPIVIC